MVDCSIVPAADGRVGSRSGLSLADTMPLCRLQGRFFHNLQQEELLNFSTAVVVSRVQVRCSSTRGVA